MIILGIDPGINVVGYGIIKVEDYNNINYLDGGIIKTSVADPLHNRLGAIAIKIEELIDNFNPTIVGLEEVFVNNNIASSMKLCYARGAIMSILGKNNCNLFEIAPNKMKKILTGNGHADKMQVSYMVRLLIKGIKGAITSDQSDALAIAYAVWVNK